MHDPDRQILVEVYSGHGNSEEFRSWREVILEPDGSKRCPEPSPDYLPSCWQAGEIIRGRCLEAGVGEAECDERAKEARQNYVRNDVVGHRTVTGESPADWGRRRPVPGLLPAGLQLPPSQHGAVHAGPGADRRERRPAALPLRLLASSDNHSARPGTGYKEYDRRDMTEMRFASFRGGILGGGSDGEPRPESVAEPEVDPRAFFGVLETERQSSFFLTGGLVAVHAEGRSRTPSGRPCSARRSTEPAAPASCSGST